MRCSRCGTVIEAEDGKHAASLAPVTRLLLMMRHSSEDRKADSALQAIVASCPNIQLLMLGGSTIGAAPEGCACQIACSTELREVAVAAVGAFTDAHADR